MDRALSAEELAERYGTTAETVRGWRYKRTGPKFFRAGKRVRYRESDVIAWEAERVEKQAAGA
jgi:predicted DNA-binding transcriptional regulator AlpA